MDKKIKIIPRGPYIVTGDVPLVQAIIETDGNGISQRWKAGKRYPDQNSYALCRCGHSQDKPYCDGSHEKAGFVGKETATHGTSEIKRYAGAEVDLLDEEGLCASMRFCDRGPRAWNAAIYSDRPGYKEIAIQEACDCAAGRLTVVEKDGTVHEPKLEQEISPVQDTAAGRRGPLWVKGGIQVEGADGTAYKIRNRMTLCRCGLSKNLPFCDTRHFNSDEMKGRDQ